MLTITPDHVDVTFNEALGRFVAGDVSLVGPNGAVAVGNPALVSGTTYRIPFVRQAASGGYTLTVGPGVLDLAGNALDQDADGVPGEAVQDTFTTTFSLALADLVPQNLSAPATAVAGQSISVSWTTTNLGSSAGATPVKEQIYLSSDALIGNDRFLGEFSFSDVGAHQATIVLPTFGQGSGGLVYLVVVTDTGATIDESNEANNGAVAGSAINIPLALRVTLPAGQVREGGTGELRGVVMRNGDTTNPLTVSLASSDSSELTVPATVTIPAGQSGVEFLATPVADSTPDGNQSVQISAAAASFATGTATLTVLDVDRPHLTLTVSNSELLEGTSTLATVTREVVSDQPLLVEFASSNTAQVATPASVLIPANQVSATFTVSTINNLTPEASANVTVTATADGYHNASQDLLVDDDDLPTLTLQLNFASVAEGAGNSTILATVRREVATDQALTVQVRVSDPSRLDVPTKVVIPAGKTLAVFGLTPIDNTLANGDHLIDIEVAGEFPLTGETISQWSRHRQPADPRR